MNKWEGVWSYTAAHHKAKVMFVSCETTVDIVDQVSLSKWWVPTFTRVNFRIQKNLLLPSKADLSEQQDLVQVLEDDLPLLQKKQPFGEKKTTSGWMRDW